jgi:hypothetical protein
MKLKINNTLLIILLYLSIAGTTAYQKISGLAVPEWFHNKFSESIIGAIPFGITISFMIIIALETSISCIMILSIYKKEYHSLNSKKYLSLGLDLSLVLFTILVFGSFLVQNYDNGALDFLYFIGTLYIKNNLKEEKLI